MGKWGAIGSSIINFCIPVWKYTSASGRLRSNSTSFDGPKLKWPVRFFDIHFEEKTIWFGQITTNQLSTLAIWTLHQTPQSHLMSLVPNTDMAAYDFSMSSHPISCSQNKSWFLLAPCPEPYMRCKKEVVWALFSERGDICLHVPLWYWEETWLISHFREEDPRKGKKLALVKKTVTFPFSRTEVPLHPPTRQYLWPWLFCFWMPLLKLPECRPLWYLQDSTLSSVCWW